MKHLIKIALFLTTITLIACGGSSGGGDPETPAGGGTPPAPTITTLTIGKATASEGENITFKVTSTLSIAVPIGFNYRMDFANQDNPASQSDFINERLTGTGHIAANSDSTTISIAIKNDTFKEPAETFRIILSDLSTTDATFTNSSNIAIGTIAESDPDGENPITIENASGAEGSELNFRVTTGSAVTEAINFAYTVDFNPANADDFTGETSGRKTIATNDSSTTISISLAQDTISEPNEAFRITLSDLKPPTSNATFDNSEAIGIILASDPQIRISDATSSSESKITFTVTSTQPISKPINLNTT